MPRFSKELEAYYGFWFRLNDLYATWAKKHGFTANTLYVLSVLDTAQEECTLRLICDKLLLPKQTVHAILQSLEEEELLEKITTEKDKRNKVLRLTKKGKSYTKQHLSPLYRLEDGALDKMGPTQKATFIESTQLFLDYLETALTKEERK